MSKLYIANCTKQIIEFLYRLPEVSGAKVQHIPIGGQVQIGGGQLDSSAIDAIIDQHSKYGLVSVDEVERTKTSFTGLCYSVDRPISVEKIERAMKRNIDALQARGKKIREEAAISVNNSIEHDLQESGLDAGLSGLEMSVQEEDNKRGDRDGPRMSEGVRVSRTEEPGPTPPRNVRRAGRR